MLLSDLKKKKKEMVKTLVGSLLDEGIAGFFNSPDCIKERLKITEQDVKELVDESVVHCNRREWDEAADILRWLSLFEPLSSSHHLRLGSVLLQIQKYDEALAAFLKGVTLDPENPELYLYIGACLLSLGDAEKAKEAFTMCVALSKDQPQYTEIFQTATEAVAI